MAQMTEAEESLEGTSIKRVREKKLYICPKSAIKKTCDAPGETYKRDLYIYTKAMKSGDKICGYMGRLDMSTYVKFVTCRIYSMTSVLYFI